MKKVRIYVGALLIIALIGYWAWIFITRQLKDHLLKNNSKVIKAVIINHRNYMGNSPVSHQYSYSYQFELNGKSYIGDSLNPKFDIGDTILVRYANDYPVFNEPLD